MRSDLRFTTAFMLVLAASGCSAKPQETPAAGTPSSAAPVPSPSPSAALEGRDFAEEARLLYRIAACAGDEALPEGIDEAVVKKHCEWLLPKMDAYRKRYLGEAQPFLAKLRPEGLPTTVVYPFGGGDLLSALTAYPDATEITTISLEHGGDPRRLRGLDGQQLGVSLDLLRRTIRQLLVLDDSASESLMKIQRGGIPGQLAFFLVGLAIHGYEPVALRYFTLDGEGKVHYLTEEEITASEKTRAQKLNTIWNAPDFSEAFSNLELIFRPVGAKPGTPLRVHRHIAANLSDGPLTRDPRLLRHLESKGHVAAVLKATSYLLWGEGFGKIRDYLLANADFMLSDSSGIAPRYATKAGFVQETYGDFDGAFIPAGRRETEAMKELWKSQPHRDLPFRFGYPDVNKKPHLLVTRRAPPSPAPAAPSPAS
jgi:hypothetical protein